MQGPCSAEELAGVFDNRQHLAERGSDVLTADSVYMFHHTNTANDWEPSRTNSDASWTCLIYVFVPTPEEGDFTMLGPGSTEPPAGGLGAYGARAVSTTP